MSIRNHSITPLWDSNVMDKKTKESRVRLTIYLNKTRVRITIPVRCTKAEFDSAISSRSNRAKELKLTISSYIAKAESILDRLLEPSKESFVRLFKSETDLSQKNKTDVYYFYDEKYQEMVKSGRIGTAKYYKGCKRSLKEFKPVLCFEDIDEKFLKAYQSFLLTKGNSISTASLRLRCLRIMFNVAIRQRFVSDKHYPFKRFSMPSATKSKKVLYPPQLKLLFDYKPQTIREERAKDYFFFCFLCNGMNFKDMAYLKWSNISGNVLNFVRQKTKNTATDVNEITVHLHKEAKRIIEKWGNTDKSSSAYVFPIIPHRFKSIEHVEEIRNRKRKIINSSLNAIGKKLGFEFNISLNLARHSFATSLYPPEQLRLVLFLKITRIKVGKAAGFSILDVIEYVPEPFSRINGFYLTHGEEGVDDGCSFSSFMGAGKEVIFSAYGDRPDRIFDKVIVYFKHPVTEVSV